MLRGRFCRSRRDLAIGVVGTPGSRGASRAHARAERGANAPRGRGRRLQYTGVHFFAVSAPCCVEDFVDLGEI